MLDLHQIAELSRAELERQCQALAQPAYLGDHTAICRVLGRYKFFIDTTDHGFGCHVLLDGFWEIWLTQFMARRVKPGMRVADIGANYGYYSLLLADLVGPEGKLHGVEPNPAAATMLRLSLAQNGFDGRSEVHELALGAGEGEATLCVPRGEPKNAHLISPGETSSWGPLHTVPVRTLDSLLADTAGLDFVKIDVEGSEEPIISGMERLIRRFHPAMVLEFNAGRYKDPAAFLARLRGLYGNVHWIDYNSELQPLDGGQILSSRIDHLLFLSPDRTG